MPIDRRDFMKALSAACAAPLMAEGVADAQAAGAERKSAAPRKRAHSPNVVIMICDDLGYGDLGSYGSKLQTPHLDRMATEGARLTHFNSGHPICSASRAALMTGRYAQRSNTVGAYMPHATSGLGLEEQTLGNLFKARDYQTKAIGKWHLGEAAPYQAVSRGFDSFYGVPYSDDMQPLPLLKDRNVVQEKADRDLLTPLYTEEALKFIDSAGEKPFFLYLAFSYPHDPAKASPRFRGKSGFGDFGDAVMEIDWSAGEIFKKLEEKGLDSDTLVFFTSDHGPWFQGSPGTLRGRKGSTFEGGTRVPLLARWPGQIQAGRVVSAWGSNLDFVPTLSALCELPLPKLPIDGASIAPLLLGEQESDVTRLPVLYFSPLGQKGQMVHCIREGSWKLRVAQASGEIYINDHGAPQESGWLPHPELYNLALDAEESYDVAGQNQERVEHMLRLLDERLATFPEETQAAYKSLKENVASVAMPPGAALRKRGSEPAYDWAWEPEDRR